MQRSVFLFLFLLLSQSPVVSAMEKTPEQAVSAFWRALSNDPGVSADMATLKRLFHAEAVVFGGRYKDGTPILRRTLIHDFLKSQENVSGKGFYECEVWREIKVYDRFAVVYSVVESRTDKDQTTADFVGVNSLQLYKVGSQWQIVSLYYHVEKAGLPIPLDGGQTGKCLD